jgi:hypothetical protein
LSEITDQAILGYDDGSKETLELEINVTK